MIFHMNACQGFILPWNGVTHWPDLFKVLTACDAGCALTTNNCSQHGGCSRVAGIGFTGLCDVGLPFDKAPRSWLVPMTDLIWDGYGLWSSEVCQSVCTPMSCAVLQLTPSACTSSSTGFCTSKYSNPCIITHVLNGDSFGSPDKSVHLLFHWDYKYVSRHLLQCANV